MAPATRSGPILPNQTDNHDTVFDPPTTALHPPPPRPSKRPPPPVSVASKRQRLDTDLMNENGNTNTSVNSNGHSEEFGQANASENSGKDATTIHLDSLESTDRQINDYGLNHIQTLPRISDNPLSTEIQTSGLEVIASSSGEFPFGAPSVFLLQTAEQQPLVAQLSQIPNGQPGGQTSVGLDNVNSASTCNQSAHGRTLIFSTPRRPTRPAGLTTTTPIAIVFAATPDWAGFGTPQNPGILQFQSTSAQPFDQPSGRIEEVDSNAPLAQNSLSTGNTSSQLGSEVPLGNTIFTTGSTEYPSDVFSETPTGYFDSTARSNPPNPHISIPKPATMPPATQTLSTALTVHSSTPNLTQLYSAVRQTLQPTLSSGTQSSNYRNSNTTMVQALNSTPASSALPRSSSVPRVSGPRSYAGSVTPASSLALDDWSSREGSIARDSPASTTVAPRMLESRTQTHIQRSLRQRDFTYDQVVFMNTMKKRWHWYLIECDSFPTNTKLALELCAQYAENQLELSRTDFKITQTSFDYVRKKESAIRNSFQFGLLSIVEAAYNVNASMTDKLTELISQSNYIYVEYDIETKKITGRYRHPCLMRVLNAVLFTKRKRGRPIGLHFMPEVIGENNPADATTESSGTGISVSMIALSCTLVLYALQSLKAGDTSQRLGTQKGKPLNFTEKKYAGLYRSFVTKLRQYNRLDELRKTYLEETMKEYLRVYVDSRDDSDVDIVPDDEMHSDGD